MIDLTAESTHQQIQSTYQCIDGIYYDKNLTDEEIEYSQQTINESLELLLPVMKNTLLSEWTITVSEKSHLGINDSHVAGATQANSKFIWIRPCSNSRVVLHEVGHAIDSYIGMASISEDWAHYYSKYCYSYREKEMHSVDTHSASSATEFFAAMFVEYYQNKDALQSQAPDMYKYLNAILTSPNPYSLTGRLINQCKKTINVLVSLVQIPVVGPSIETKMTEIEPQIANNSLININDYQSVVDYSWMSTDSQQVITIMLDMINNPDKYPITEYHSSILSDGYVVEFEYAWTMNQYLELLSFTSLYFGDEDLDPIDINVINNRTTRIILKKNIIFEAEKQRLVSQEKVDNVIRNLKSGTEQEIMIQVANYIMKHSTYQLEQHSDFNSFWKNKKGDCVMYAMVFHQFATRLGIKSTIVSIKELNGDGHVYNMLTFKDGTSYYYDLSSNVIQSTQPLTKTNYVYNYWIELE